MGRVDAGLAALRSGLARIGRHLRHGGAAYGVLLISLLLTALAWYYVRQRGPVPVRADYPSGP